MKDPLLLFCLLLFVQPLHAQNTLNDTLIKQLTIIGVDDQKYRNRMGELRAKYASDTAELGRQLNAIRTVWRETDSINLVKVTAIIEQYGWLGEDVVGPSGNQTLFMVIQHADLATQQKYLPMLRQAVADKKLRASSLALLEDRIAIREGRKQIYGTQVSMNMKTGKNKLLPLDDPDNVDQRRTAAGLMPLAQYLKAYFNIDWDLKKYKKGKLIP
ncbi:MAG: DUF6624 domain-containing protein [Bacteroidota bacterium]